MFGSKKKNATKSSSNLVPVGSSNTFNSLVQGTSVTGDITADSDIRIDGKLKGTLECAAKVVIGPTGMVEGEIRCQNAVIEGRFKGVLKVAQLLQVKEKAEVNGNISTDKIIVQSGAVFNVVCQMGNTPAVTSKGAGRKSDLKQFLKDAQPGRLKRKSQHRKKGRTSSNEYLKYSGMAFEMFAIMGLFVFAGSKADESMQNQKAYFTVLGAIIGVLVAFYYTLKDFFIKKNDDDK